jgi:hypothetical protein
VLARESKIMAADLFGSAARGVPGLPERATMEEIKFLRLVPGVP